MTNDTHCDRTCQLHEDMHDWKDKVDKCIYDDDKGMLVKLTKMIEGFKLVQKIVYGACGIALLAFFTTVVGLAIPKQETSDIKALLNTVNEIKQDQERRKAMEH